MECQKYTAGEPLTKPFELELSTGDDDLDFDKWFAKNGLTTDREWEHAQIWNGPGFRLVELCDNWCGQEWYIILPESFTDFYIKVLIPHLMFTDSYPSKEGKLTEAFKKRTAA